MTWYFDSHIHLSDSAYLTDMEFILNGMEYLKLKACCVSMDVENSLQTLDLAKNNELVLKILVGASESDYAYHHIQEFTTDTNTYQNALRKTTCSGGGDDFESGMDGLMQTITCEGKT